MNPRILIVEDEEDLTLLLRYNLEAAGYPPSAFDTVVCTHLHFDHVGWNTKMEDGRWVPAPVDPDGRAVAVGTVLRALSAAAGRPFPDPARLRPVRPAADGPRGSGGVPRARAFGGVPRRSYFHWPARRRAMRAWASGGQTQ